MTELVSDVERERQIKKSSSQSSSGQNQKQASPVKQEKPKQTLDDFLDFDKPAVKV